MRTVTPPCTWRRHGGAHFGAWELVPSLLFYGVSTEPEPPAKGFGREEAFAMKTQLVLGTGAALTLALMGSVANAQTVVNQAPPQPAVVASPPAQTTVVAAAPATRETVVATGPNAALFKSGLFVFGIPYGTSVVVAATSNRDEDKNLFIPLAGPWIDFANRQNCGNVGNPSCDGETAIKVLLAADGILQAIGGIELIAAFMVPESPAVVAKAKEQPRFMMAPSRVGTGYGLAAAGAF